MLYRGHYSGFGLVCSLSFAVPQTWLQLEAKYHEPVCSPVGRCIYCGRTSVTLSDEHIIAVAIGGRWVLPHASCKRCAKLTTRLEGHCFAGTIKAYGTQVGLHGRRKKKVPTAFTMAVRHLNGHVETKELPTEEYPAFMIMPFLHSPPAFLYPMEQRMELKLTAWAHVTNPEVIKQYPKGTRVGGTPFHPGKWLRMLAKVAHSYAVAKEGIDGFTPLLRDLIRGRDDDYGLLIGILDRKTPQERGTLHAVYLWIAHVSGAVEKRYLVAEIHLFTNLGAPHYHIVVGEL